MTSPSILIVEARFYPDISDALLAGARAVFEAEGVRFERAEVPGALEIVPAITLAEASGHGFDGYVALGCVIRGETGHYDIVAGESARGLTDLAVSRALAIGNGILTVDTHQQAMVRASVDGRDKGGDAARACLALIALRRRFQAQRNG